jgi:hypothetical protein
MAEEDEVTTTQTSSTYSQLVSEDQLGVLSQAAGLTGIPVAVLIAAANAKTWSKSGDDRDVRDSGGYATRNSHKELNSNEQIACHDPSYSCEDSIGETDLIPWINTPSEQQPSSAIGHFEATPSHERNNLDGLWDYSDRSQVDLPSHSLSSNQDVWDRQLLSIPLATTVSLPDAIQLKLQHLEDSRIINTTTGILAEMDFFGNTSNLDESGESMRDPFLGQSSSTALH